MNTIVVVILVVRVFNHERLASTSTAPDFELLEDEGACDHDNNDDEEKKNNTYDNHYYDDGRVVISIALGCC